ncbi:MULTISPECIES: DUF309 domain-containing protein [Niallia]|uniref:DUF309 domain-containing protein n=1 Tax=Niallia TaxID=2837506 RepID=UPI00155FF535|nr:DUF309 domain-containing protein [Niallia circulans]NRG30238.1 DUF309 domain-containing protein [Niallia circulans]
MYPNEYIEFLVHFHCDQDYFECHEILEEYWKKVDPGNKDSIWVGFILLAVSAYHHRRKNFKGAEKTLIKSKQLLEKKQDLIKKLGLDNSKLLLLLKIQEEHIKQHHAFCTYHLPIKDHNLEMNCIDSAHIKGLKWKTREPVPFEIIHRHISRDRSMVIKERENALLQRKQKDKHF